MRSDRKCCRESVAKRLRRRTSCVVLLFLASVNAFGQFVWLAPVGGFWGSNSSWASLTAPGPGSGDTDVFIDYSPYTLTGGPGGFESTLNHTVEIRSLFSRADFRLTGSLRLNGGGSDLQGRLTMTSGTLSGEGLTVTGETLLSGTLHRVIAGGPHRFLGGGRSDGGILTCTGGSLQFGGVFTAVDGTWRDGAYTILPDAVLRKTGGSGSLLLATNHMSASRSVHNTGTLEAASGRVELHAGGTHTGTFRGSGGSVAFVAGTHNMLAGSRFEGGVLVSGATLLLPTPNDTIELIGESEFQSGILSGSGRLIGSGSLRLTTASLHMIDGTPTNEAALQFEEGEVIAQNTEFHNAGYMRVVGNRFWRDGVIHNSGIIEKVGQGDAELCKPYVTGPTGLNNVGTVSCLEGGLVFTSNGRHAGDFSTPGGRIDFRGGTHIFEPTCRFDTRVSFRAGEFFFPGGSTMNLETALNLYGGTLGTADPESVRLTGAGSLEILGSCVLRGSMILNCTLNWHTGGINGHSLDLRNEGTIRIGSGSSMSFDRVTNRGTIEKTSGETTEFRRDSATSRFDNSGVVRSEAGVLGIVCPGTHTGVFEGIGGRVTFTNHGHEFRNGSILRGVDFSTATLNVPAENTVMISDVNVYRATLAGHGRLEGPGPLTVTSSSRLSDSLHLSVPTTVTGTITSTGATLTNHGTITLRTGSTLNWRDGIIENLGVIRSESGTTNLCIDSGGGARSLRNRSMVLAHGSTIRIYGTGIHSGILSTSNNGSLFLYEGPHTLLDGVRLGTGTSIAAPVLADATVTIDGESTWLGPTWSGSNRIVGGLWRWKGALEKRFIGSTDCETDVLHEQGEVRATDSRITLRGVTSVVDSLSWRDGEWINHGTIRKDVGSGMTTLGSHRFGGLRSFSNPGHLEVTSGTLFIDSPLRSYNESEAKMIEGAYRARATGQLRLPIGPVRFNRGVFRIDGTDANITQRDGTTPALQELRSNRGSVQLMNGGSIDLLGPVSNHGDLSIGSSSFLSIDGTYSQSAGRTHTDGTLLASINIIGGEISGIGTIGGGTVSSARVSPGNGTGVLAIDGDVTMRGASLQIEAQGMTPGTFDQLAISGVVTIEGGRLQAGASPYTTIVAGTVFDAVTALSRTGTFAEHPDPNDWAISYGPYFVRLTALRVIRGPVTISGTIDLNGWAVSYSSAPMRFQLRQGGLVVEEHTVAPNPDRSFTLQSHRRGIYDLYVTGQHWLVRRLPTPLVLTDAGVGGLEVAMINGDVDGNNEVDIGDFARLSAAYGSAVEDPSFDSAADLDGGGDIDFLDFIILRLNYGLLGDY